MIVRWSTRAAGQLFRAADTLERRRAGTGERLYDAVDAIVAILREQPRAFARATDEQRVEIRRALVARYGYWIIYRVDGEAIEVLVLAFWSTRRQPEGWRTSR